jgi:hypothetical protein
MSIFTNTKSPSGEQAQSPSPESGANHGGEKSVEQMPDELGLAGESVDFNSVLSAVSGNGALDAAGECAQKDLNISSVIGNIQDEGPASRKGTQSAASDKPLPAADQQTTDGSLQPAIEKPASSVEQSDHTPPPNSRVAEGSAATEAGSQTTGSPATPWASILMRLVITLLVVILAGMGYMLYEQGPGDQALQSELVQLRQKLQETEVSVAALERQLQQQQKAIQGLVTPAQLQQRLESQRQDIDAWLQSRMADSQAQLVQPAALPPPVKPVQDKAATQVEAASASETQHAASPVAAEVEGNKIASNRTKPEKETETMAGQGSGAGRWMVHLASYGNRHQAEKALHKYATNAPDAGIQTASVKGRDVYRVSVSGFSSKKEALAYRDKMQRELGLKGVWIAKNKKITK